MSTGILVVKATGTVFAGASAVKDPQMPVSADRLKHCLCVYHSQVRSNGHGFVTLDMVRRIGTAVESDLHYDAQI